MIAACADVVGSLLRPGELLEARERLGRGEISPPEFKSVEDAAVEAVIRLQEDAGLAVVTDGEIGCRQCQGGTDMTAKDPQLVEISEQLQEFRQQLFRTLLPDTHPASFAATVAPPITRTDQAILDPSAQAAFLAAYNTLNSQGWLGPFVAIHADMSHRMHHSMGPVGAQRFLPWHRVYLYVLEQHLQSLDPTVTIPYWDWSTSHEVPPWLQGPDGMPTIQNVNGTNITVIRSPGDPNQLPSPTDVQNILNGPDFTTFEDDLETTHDGVHVWVGGIMSVIPTAPADPLFWMHHANVDRIWTSWQNNHPDQNPSLNPPGDTLDPWTDTELKTRHISNYGYQYDVLP